MEGTAIASLRPANEGAYGPCQECGRVHSLPLGRAESHALDLMRELQSIGRLDYLASAKEADPRLSFENQFPPGRGNMFGVLECEDPNGQTILLRAFSSLRDGIRQIDGWVLPILSAETYRATILPAQREIKELTTTMSGFDPSESEYLSLSEERADVSRRLWAEMCDAYRFRNFRGEERSLADAIWPPAPAPGGVGECCAPKLLNHAVLHGLRPRSLAEFFWGEDGRSGKRVAGEFYPSCEARCRPILGFMLCGLDD